MHMDNLEAIRRNNLGRDPERLAMKYSKMRQSPFVFLRGACHLFYDNLPDVDIFRNAPVSWCCGDMHFENFGSYKGENRLVYFDVNDFEEAALAPVTWDLARLLVSILCGADALNATEEEAKEAAKSCLDAYKGALLNGKPLWVERDTSNGLVKDLLGDLQNRLRSDFLDRRTKKYGNLRMLKVDGVKALPASAEQKGMVVEFMGKFAQTQPSPEFYRVIDVARRIAGTGSLGVDRYVVLVEGKGSPDSNYLLDIKEAKPSALYPRLSGFGLKQPQWESEARRVVSVQKRMQAVDHAFLHAVQMDGKSCILKALQPSEDRVAIGEWGRKLDRLKAVVSTMGRVLAWDHLRSSGRSGASNADELVEFAATLREEEMLDAAQSMTQTTRSQWQEFVESGLA